jgi:hypothetical protein
MRKSKSAYILTCNSALVILSGLCLLKMNPSAWRSPIIVGGLCAIGMLIIGVIFIEPRLSKLAKLEISLSDNLSKQISFCAFTEAALGSVALIAMIISGYG